MAAKRCVTLLLLLGLGGSPGCYYLHVASGQLRLLRARQPIASLIENPATPPRLRDDLALVLDVRRYARELGLDVGERYTSYVPWPADRIVTIVVATRPGELEPAGFRFPVVGRVPYKGWFDAERARSEAQRLRDAGLDTCVAPVAAYSTLGWFDDPVTEPMLREGRARLVETLLHELVHATIFAPSAADFNEGVATFVGQEAAVRFFEQSDGPEAAAATRQRDAVTDDRAVLARRLALREQLAELYARMPEVPARRAERERLVAAAREQIAALPLRTRDAGAVARAARLNDACLSLTGTYAADLERYAAHLDALDGDLPALVRAAREAAGQDRPRAALLDPR